MPDRETEPTGRLLVFRLGPFRSQHHHDHGATVCQEACLATATAFRGRGSARGGSGQEKLPRPWILFRL